MGGKALRKCKTRRVDRCEYDEISSIVLAIVAKYFASVGVPKFLDTKKDFGDVDIIVASQLNPKLDKKSVRQAIFTELNSSEMVNNGPVDSFEFRNFQIDLIEVPIESFSAALQFMSWGDLGMLVGVTANSLGLSYGETGLYLPVYAEPQLYEDFSSLQQALTTPVPKPKFYNEINRKSDGKLLKLGLIGKVLLTNQMNEVYSFLGFHCNTDVSKLHFDNEEEIFQFIIKSDYFDPEAYGVLSDQNEDQEPSEVVVLQSAEDGRYEGFNIDPSRLNKKYRDRLFKRPIFAHFLKKICQENHQNTIDYNAEIDAIEATMIYDVENKTDKRSQRRTFHRCRALDYFHKWSEYEHIIMVERLKKLARDLAPSNIWVMDMVKLTGKSLGNWLQNFKSAKANCYQDVNPLLVCFPELSGYEKWLVEQSDTECIQQCMVDYHKSNKS